MPVWGNSSQQAYFKIIGDNLSSSPNRNLSNGLLLFNRYKGSDNLYYAGLRVDGYAVIKKKANGTYYTMDEKPVFAGIYNHDSNPDLLPKNQWLGIRADTSNLLDGSVRIELFTDIGDTGNWTRVLDVTDNGKSFGGAVFASGHGGIRTDFMDVEFKDYMITGE